MSRRGALLALGLVLLVGGGLRLGRWSEERRGPLARAPTGDERTYDQWAQRIARGEAEPRVPYQAPLHAYVLAGWHRVLSPPRARDAQRLFSILLGVGTAGLAFAIGRRLSAGDDRVGLVAAAVTALHEPLVYYEPTLLRDGPATFTVALVAWLLVVLVQRQRRPSRATSRARTLGLAGALGVALGAGALLRENLLLVGVAVGGWVAWRALRAERTLRAAAPALALALGAGLLLPLLPWYAQNHRLEGSFSPFPTWNGGCVFYIANQRANPGPGYMRPEFVPSANPEGEVLGFRREAERRTGRSLTPHEVSSFWLAEGLEEVVSDPGAYLGKVWDRARYYLASGELVHARDPRLDARSSSVLQLPLPGLGIFVGFAGLGFAVLRRRPGAQAVGLLVLTLAATTVPVAFATRYRLPAVPLLAVLAAVGLRRASADLARARGGGTGRPLLPGAAALGVGLALTLVSVPYTPAHEAMSRWNRVMAWMALERPQAAFEEVEAVDEARRAGAWHRLGEVLVDNGEGALAEEAFRRCADLDPDRPEPWVGLGGVLFRDDRLEAGRAAFERALAIDPRRADAWAGLAAARLRAGDLAAAHEAAARARALAPGEPGYRRLEAELRRRLEAGPAGEDDGR